MSAPASKRREPQSKRARRAQILAEAVTVLCPECEAAQPAFGGSEFWTWEELEKATSIGPVRPCVSCDVSLIFGADSKVSFR